MDLTAEDSDERLVDIVAVSWGLTTIGSGKATFTNPESRDAERIINEAWHKKERRADAVTNDWMKQALRACGLVTSQANNKHVDCVSYCNGR